MSVFDIFVGSATIISCIVSVYTAFQVNGIKKKINVNQTVRDTKLQDSKISQAGRDINLKGRE